MAIAPGLFLADGYCTLATPGTAFALLILTAVSWGVGLPYLGAFSILIVGLSALRQEFAHNQGLNKIILLGPLFIAIPVAACVQHFTATQFIARMVPAWIPGHMFWTLFVGACLIAAALSIAARKYSWLSSALLGVMIFLFVCLISVPAIAGAPRNRLLWAVGLRDLAFSAGAFSLAASHKEAWRQRVRDRVLTLARFIVAVAITFFGVEQVLHPEFAPGVPLAKLTPLWIPVHVLWGYATGAICSWRRLLANSEASPFGGNLAGADDSPACGLHLCAHRGCGSRRHRKCFNYLVDTLFLSGWLLLGP